MTCAVHTSVGNGSRLEDVVALTLAIRGQCHAIVGCINRPHELIDRLRAIDETLDFIVECIGGVGTAGEEERRAVTLDLTDLIAQVVRRFDGLARMSGVRIEMDGGRASTPVRCRPALLGATLGRLLAEAVSTADAGAVVRLDRRVRGTTPVVVVSRRCPTEPHVRGQRAKAIAWQVIAGDRTGGEGPHGPRPARPVMGMCA